MVKHEDTELLLGWMNSDSGNFIAFLDVLASVSDGEGHRDLMKLARSTASGLPRATIPHDRARARMRNSI